MKEKFLGIVFFVLLISKLFGQDYIVKNYGPAEGLKAANVYSYYQDSLGFIWMGLTDGLCYFNGKDFRSFFKPIELFDESIRDVDRNFKGNLLLKKRRGEVWEFDGENFKKYLFNHKILDSSEITHIQFYDDRLFIGTRFNGLFVDDNHQIVQVSEIKEHVLSIKEDVYDNLLITTENTVYEYKNGKFSLLFKPDVSSFSEFIKHKNEDFWIMSANDGVYTKKETQWEPVFEKNNFGLNELTEDRNSVVWLGSLAGLFRIEENLNDKIYDKQEIFDESIIKVFIDRDDNIWASSYGKGIYKLTKNRFQNYKYPSSFPGEWGMITLKDNKGDLWISIANYGFVRYKDEKFYKYYTYDQFPPNESYNCAIDLDSCILFGGDSITVKFKDGEFSLFTREEEPKEWGFWGFLKSNENLYSILNYSIYTYTDNKWEPANYFSSDEVVCILFADSRNILWAGTDSGLYKIQDEEILRFKQGNLSNNIQINSIYESPDSTLWVGADNGLYQIKNDSLIQFINEDNGLVDNEVTSITMKDSILYLGTRVGLSLYFNGRFRNYTTSDGLLSNFIFMPRIETVGDKLFMGAGNGFSVMNISGLNKDSNVNVILSKVTTENDTIDFNPLNYKEVENFDFNYSTDFINFDFDVVHFKNEIIKYRYTLHRNKKKKTYLSDKSEINLQGIKSGNFILVFEYQDILGEWQTGYEQKFYIKPPIYLSKPVLILYVIVVLLLAGFFLVKNKIKRNGKYKTSSLTKNRHKEIKLLLDELLIKEKIYTNPDLSLKMLAEKLDCSREYISQVINMEYKQNFNTLMNKYRIEEAKKLLVEKNGKYNYSILQIAFEVGFNSKSAFNAAFKKYTSFTPSEYRKHEG